MNMCVGVDQFAAVDHSADNQLTSSEHYSSGQRAAAVLHKPGCCAGQQHPDMLWYVCRCCCCRCCQPCWSCWCAHGALRALLRTCQQRAGLRGGQQRCECTSRGGGCCCKVAWCYEARLVHSYHRHVGWGGLWCYCTRVVVRAFGEVNRDVSKQRELVTVQDTVGIAWCIRMFLAVALGWLCMRPCWCLGESHILS